MNGHVAAEVDAVSGEQPGFQAEERRGRSGTDGRPAHRAGIGVEPAWNVECQNRNARAIRALDQRGVFRGERSREADAEQPIDDQRSAPSGGNVGHGRSTRDYKGAMGVARVGWQPRGFAAKDDGHVEEQLAQSARDDECIAAVVAGPRQHEHGSIARTGHADGDVGGREPGALHQRLPAGCGFHAAQFVGPEYRQQAHGDHYRAMARSRRLASTAGTAAAIPRV